MKYLVCDLYGDDYERLQNPVLVVPLTSDFRDAVASALRLFPLVTTRHADAVRVDVALVGVKAYERTGELPAAIEERDFARPTAVDLPADLVDAADELEVELAVIAVTGGDRVSGEIQVVVKDDQGDAVRLWADAISQEDVAAWAAAGVVERVMTEIAEEEDA